MAGTHKISSSLFVQSGSTAQFKSGISSSGITSKNAIFAREFKDLNFGPSDSDPLLLVGTQSAGGGLTECVTTVNTPFQLSASGDFNHFTFLENKGAEGWFQISSGSQKGLIEKSFVNVEGKSTPGVYEYLVLAASTSSLKTVTKGTTVTVTN
jgi:hypothetical protein